MIGWFLGVIIKSCLQDLENTALPKCLRPPMWQPIKHFTETGFHSNHPKRRSRKSIFQVTKSQVFTLRTPPPHFLKKLFDSTLIQLHVINIFCVKLYGRVKNQNPQKFPKKHLNRLRSILRTWLLPPCPTMNWWVSWPGANSFCCC